MKKLIMAFGIVFFMTIVTVSKAQSSIKKSEKITQDEVPVLVLKSFERDFLSLGGLNATGKWTVNYGFVVNANGEDTPRPSTYTFTLKTRKDETHVEISYFPNGEIEASHGLTALRTNTAGKN